MSDQIPELKPCPNPECVGDACAYLPEVGALPDGFAQAHCPLCCVRGPISETRNGALRAWNLLPRVEPQRLPLLLEVDRIGEFKACRLLELLSERWLFECDPSLVSALRAQLVSDDDFQTYLNAQLEYRALCEERGVPLESEREDVDEYEAFSQAEDDRAQAYGEPLQ